MNPLHRITGPDSPFPDTQLAWPEHSDAPGLLAVGGELTPERLTQAYRKGIFPWYSAGQPVLWWSPEPRMVMFPAEFKLSTSLRKTIRRFARSHHSEVRIDTDFRRVISACAQVSRRGQLGTWIVPDMVHAYCRWHELGTAHSVETWIDGELVGGLYCIGIGHMVFGESMFSHRTDASKIAFAALICFCRWHGVDVIDCQQRTPHLQSLGAREISRTEFEPLLPPRLSGPKIADWTYDPAMWELLEPPSPHAQDIGT